MNPKKWKELRTEVFKRDGKFCIFCGVSETPANQMQVDHIKPRSKFPELALEFSNLRVLCAKCNSSKGDREEVNRDREDCGETLIHEARGTLVDIYFEICDQGNPYLADDPQQAIKYLLTQMMYDRMAMLKFMHAYEKDSAFKISRAYQACEERMRGKDIQDEDLSDDPA